jgi:predicted ATPase/DNA-binding winged helix-turn-helix (wHTH) protein
MKDAFSFGPFRLYQGQRILWKNGTVVPLGSRAFDMLVAMVEHYGKVLAPAELMAIAWPGLIVEDSNVRVQVANLRRTLGCGRDGARYIANVAGRGYCFVEPVTRLESVDHPSPTTSEPGAAPEAPHVDRVTHTSGSLSGFPPLLEGTIGRDACVAELAQVVKERRLVTVVGAAGAGKTTLAILVAHALDASDSSISFVDLSTVDGDDMVVEALAAAVGYIPSGGDLLPGLLEVLSTGRTLIVLDNCEHVIGAVATLCLQIVEGTSTVSFLNTSREALRIQEEFVYLLRPLASPPDMRRLTAREAMAWPAIQLFMKRAREGGARDALSDEETPTVAGLCRRLDGNPHAIGLVASRVGTYGIQGVADLFENQVALHWQGRRDAIPRHQTVEALIDWSHKLLPERDRQVLHRLSVFSGSFPLEAAVAVTSDDAIDAFQVGEAIGDLVDKSLVAVSQQSPGTHIRLLETTRAYAASRLARLRTTHEFARRHAEYYAEQLRKHVDHRLMPQTESVHLRGPEIDNVRAALEWASSKGHDPALAAEISCMAAPLFLERGLIRECKRTCERAIKELPDQFRSTRIELGLLDSLAITYYSGGDYDGAMKPVVERGLEISRQLGDNRSMFHFLAGLHLAMMANGEFQNSLSVCEQYASTTKTHGGPTESIIAGWMEASSKHYSGDQVAADASYSASSQLVAQHEMRPLHYFEMKERIIASIGLARVKWALGLPKQAVHMAIKAIDDGRSHPDSFYMCVTLCFSILLGNGLTDQAEELIEELQNVAIDYKVAVRRQVIDVLKGQLLLRQGHWQAAISHLQECLAMLPPPKMSVVRTDALQALAEAQRACGHFAGALDSINEAIDLAKDTKGEFNLPDLLRTKAEVLMSLPHVGMEEVDGVLSEAVDCARKQGALGWELRVSLTVAQARASQGKKSEAREMLERVYSRFTEGFDTQDLKAAAQAIRSL